MLPRGLIFLASLWLIGSWQLSLGGIAPIQPTSTAYVPGVRMMVQCLAIGVIVAWPLLRLSEAPCSWSVRRSLVDLIALVALVQIVIWPLRLVTPWSIARLVAIDLTLVSWMAIVGAIIAISSRSSLRRIADTSGMVPAEAPPGRCRTIGMLLILAVALGGPLIAGLPAHRSIESIDLLASVRASMVATSPFVALHALASTGAGPLREPERIVTIAAMLAAVLAWLGLWTVMFSGRDAGRDRGRTLGIACEVASPAPGPYPDR